MIPYIISSWRGGISDENSVGVPGAFKHGYGLDIHGRDDVLTTKQAMVTVYGSASTTLTGIINFFVNASDGTTYAFGSTGSIFARSGDGQWTFVYNDENGAIKGASEWELDTGVNYLFWATNTSVARKPLRGTNGTLDSGAALWDDVTADWKTTLDAADWHTMAPASGSLLVANANKLAEISFSGSFDASALNIRPGNLIKALEERDDYAIFGSGREDQAEEGHLWSWITSADLWVQKKRIPIKGVNSLISAELTLLQGGSDGEIFFSDFASAIPLHGVPGGGQTYPGGVAIEDDIAIFGFFGGTYPGVWGYGRKRKNRPYALNYLYRLAQTVAGSTISTIAAITVANDTTLVSWGTTDGSTSEYGVDSVSSTTKASGLFEGLEFNAGAPHLKKLFNTVKIAMAPLPSGCSISVKVKQDIASTGGDSSAGSGWKYCVQGDGSTTFSQTDAVEAIFMVNGNANTYEVGVELNPSSNVTPLIRAVVTYIAEESQDHG